MYKMNEQERAEREQTKKLHKSIRELPPSRYRDFAWGYIRGFKYRRIERSHHISIIDLGRKAEPGKTSRSYTQMGAYLFTEEGLFYEHNLPSSYQLHKLLSSFITISEKELTDWIMDPSGAIPPPPPRVKQPKPEILAAATQ